MKLLKTSNVILFLIGLSLISCQSDDDNCTTGEGTLTTKKINVPNFKGIDMAIAGNVVITQGETKEISITGYPNIIEKMETNVADDIWSIELKNNCYNYSKLKINITTPQIEKIYLSGSGNIVVNDFENQNDMTVKISGSGNIDLNNITGPENLTVKISGSGNINVNDTFSMLKNLDISMSGSGNFNGFLIQTKTCNISSSGSCSSEVHVLDNLNLSLSGSGNAYYKGTPEITTSISGSGKLINAN
ncbi:putative autotransporter adhesin-like protein [Aquimarina sp. MAR_2010_214]|uniref:head GIN domain-containing protein n=1 Tax=Aquimarina sp. MAR_2010_214 TaxID=1250026 RepID=UPI000C7064BA|nr:head GIN domain-containing protein [Aquimarina sp. MAR_2010_214]PKV50257.1 putative autotransporter adhesin-like protein [Aquimarina sp. MAR_2010_214]